MKPNKILMVVAGVLLASGILFFSLNRTPFEERPPALGSFAPRIASADVYGEMVGLSKYDDHVVILNFWADWCGPCKDQLRVFEKLFREYTDRGFTVIAVAIDDVSEETVRKMGLSYPVLKANPRLTQEYGNVNTVPVTFVIGKDRKILRKHKKYYSEKSLRQELEATLKM